MARKPRIASISGIYHIVLKATGDQIIFEDNSDRTNFLKRINKLHEKYNFKIFAYCLMDNHVHLLMQFGDSLELFFKSLECSFVFWYNKKYGRHGHLFQDRFYSEPVDTENYFLVALRYILRNPLKAGLCRKIWDYKWSSAEEYAYGDGVFCDVEMAALIAGGRKNLVKFLNEDIDDECLEIKKSKFLISDEEGLSVLRKISKCKNTTEFQKLCKWEQMQYVEVLYKKGLYPQQIARLCGISKSTVFRSVRRVKELKAEEKVAGGRAEVRPRVSKMGNSSVPECQVY